MKLMCEHGHEYENCPKCTDLDVPGAGMGTLCAHGVSSLISCHVCEADAIDEAAQRVSAMAADHERRDCEMLALIVEKQRRDITERDELIELQAQALDEVKAQLSGFHAALPLQSKVRTELMRMRDVLTKQIDACAAYPDQKALMRQGLMHFWRAAHAAVGGGK